MSYTESKKQIDKIRQEYDRKGNIIFLVACQYIVEHGQYNFRNQKWFDSCIYNVDNKHDRADQDGKVLWIGRELEKAMLECARELADVNAYDFLMYIQREMRLGGEVGEPDYHRAMQIIRNCLCYVGDIYGVLNTGDRERLENFRAMELTDDEIMYFGWEHLLDTEDKEDFG